MREIKWTSVPCNKVEYNMRSLDIRCDLGASVAFFQNADDCAYFFFSTVMNVWWN